MKERPILFSGAMVRAILDGRKTQTRRAYTAKNGGVWPNRNDLPGMRQIMRNCSFGQPGDRLWVRETWAQTDGRYEMVTLAYRASDDGKALLNDRWRPSIHMPRWASRILLEITAVRIERLNDISEKDAWAEGCEGFDDDVTGGKSGYSEFAELWQSINGTGSWDVNPWVWVIEFRKFEA